jgi:hypothetical protein
VTSMLFPGWGDARAYLVEALLRYKLEGRGLIPDESLDFSIDLILPAALWSCG